MRTLIGTKIGGIVGAVGLSAVMTLLHTLTAPGMTGDEYYPLLWFFITAPLGAALGGVTGGALGYSASGHSRRETGLICVTGGAVVAFLLGLLLLFFVRGCLEESGFVEFFLRVLLPIFGPPFLWGCLLIRRGLTLMGQ